MKAMSLRISMATLSPCLTPSFCKPPAMRSTRSATSSWLRLRGPLMMPWKRDEFSVITLFFLDRGLVYDCHGRACPGHPRLCFVSTQNVDHRDKPGDDGVWRYTSANRGARFSILARTASVWLGLPSNFCCSTDSAI